MAGTARIAEFEAELDVKIQTFESRVRELRNVVTKDLQDLTAQMDHCIQETYLATDNIEMPECKEKRRFYTKLAKFEADRFQLLRKTAMLVDILLSNPDVQISRLPSSGL
jgi:hypothetical protein